VFCAKAWPPNISSAPASHTTKLRFMLPPRSCRCVASAARLAEIPARRERLKRGCGFAQDVDDRVDVRALGDERRRDEGRIAGALEVEAVVEELLLQDVAAPARHAVRLEVERREHAVAADVGDALRSAQREHAVL